MDFRNIKGFNFEKFYVWLNINWEELTGVESFFIPLALIIEVYIISKKQMALDLKEFFLCFSFVEITGFF